MRRRLEDTFNRSVAAPVADIETEAMTRVRQRSNDEDWMTGNLGHATFFHQTARPVDGRPDPVAHAHVVALNVARDLVEESIRRCSSEKLREMLLFMNASSFAVLSQVVNLGI